MPRFRTTPRALPQLLLATLLFFCGHARAATVDRVAAVVGGHVIMLSEVEEQAAPYLRMIKESDVLARAKAVATALYERCERMVDIVLVEDEAARLHITSSAAEVDAAIDAIAKQNNLTRPALFEAARDQGFDESAYREDVRVQLLEMKVMQLRKVTKEVELTAETLHRALRANVYVEVRLSR